MAENMQDEHIPKYAAGCDEDRLYTKKQIPKHTGENWFFNILLIIIIIFTVVRFIIAPLKDAGVIELPSFQTPTMGNVPFPVQQVIPQEVPFSILQTKPQEIPQPVNHGSPDIELISTDYNSEFTKLFVTYICENNTELPFYDIKVTINLVNKSDEILQTKVSNSIDTLDAQTSAEVIVVFPYKDEYRGQEINVNGKFEYKPRN